MQGLLGYDVLRTSPGSEIIVLWSSSHLAICRHRPTPSIVPVRSLGGLRCFGVQHQLTL